MWRDIYVNWTVEGNGITFTSFGRSLMHWMLNRACTFEGALDVSIPGRAYLDGYFNIPDRIGTAEFIEEFDKFAAASGWIRKG